MLSGVIAECIFINDGSTDNSGEVLAAALAQVSFKHQTLTQSNGGKSSAIKAGAKLAQSSHVIILDADLELDTHDVVELWKVVQDGKADVVFGSRFVGGESHRILYFWHTMMNKFLTLLSNVFSDLNHYLLIYLLVNLHINVVLFYFFFC
jgi:glycosyltransferase involved in cell wall biosynthesis